MHYVVDNANLIVDVDDSWDEAAAAAEGGTGAMRHRVMGRPLEAFMLGDATKMFVRAALEAARVLGQTRVLPYRCDTPSEHRRFEMVISPLAGGHVKVEHRLILATPVAHRTRRSLPSVIQGQERVGWRCSQCLKVRMLSTNVWLEVERPPLGTLTQDVCPTCANGLFEQANEGSKT